MKKKYYFYSKGDKDRAISQLLKNLSQGLNPCSSNSESIEFTNFFTRKSDATKARNKEIKHLNQSISQAHVDSFVFLNEKLSKIKNMELNCIEVAIA